MICERSQTGEFPLVKLPDVLRSLWDEHRSKVDNVIRVTSFNLLIVSTGETDPELSELVDALELSHPCRVLWAKLKSEKAWGESTAELALTTSCEGRQVSSEQVVLRCGNEPKRIASIILPMIHSGLPTHLLWWKAGPLDGSLYRRLKDRARLILWQPEAAPSDWSLELLGRSWSGPFEREHALYPLDWFRIHGMRSQIARVFDKGPTKVRAYDPAAEMSLAHKLLQGWLKARLGNNPEMDFRWTSGERGCRIQEPEELELHLFDNISAARYALDHPDRDPIFAQSLKALLGERIEKT